MAYINQKRSRRRFSTTTLDRFRGGKLTPVKAEFVEPGEAGVYSQTITMQLDPIAGRMITPVWGEVVCMFIPQQGVDMLRDPNAVHAGTATALRAKLMSGNPVGVLEPAGEISDRCGVNPMAINGQWMVRDAVRLAHNVGVNFLRRRAYLKATVLSAADCQGYGVANVGVTTPAILSETVLDMFLGALDPDDRADGAVRLKLPNLDLPVKGIGTVGTLGAAPTSRTGVRQTDPSDATSFTWARNTSDGNMTIEVDSNSTTTARPKIYAKMSNVYAGDVSLRDFYRAERVDEFTRLFAQMLEDDPELGEQNVVAYCLGLSVETDHLPIVLYEDRRMFGAAIKQATDGSGINSDVMRSDMVLRHSFTVPVPRTELGGVLVTFACVKPEETLGYQPHPIATVPFTATNYVGDDLEREVPKPVVLRQLDGSRDVNGAPALPVGSETTVAFYTGLNQMKVNYVSYGISRRLDPTTVDNKTATWLLQMPLSVTADNILYPATLSHYPFMDQLAEVCTCVTNTTLHFASPMVVGATPVEDVGIADTTDLFNEVP